jgi:hypothetical protein
MRSVAKHYGVYRKVHLLEGTSTGIPGDLTGMAQNRVRLRPPSKPRPRCPCRLSHPNLGGDLLPSEATVSAAERPALGTTQWDQSESDLVNSLLQFSRGSLSDSISRIKWRTFTVIGLQRPRKE